jgi:hypothetical protein
MIIIGHELIPYKPLYRIQTLHDIKATPSNSTLLFPISHNDMVQYAQRNGLTFALEVQTLTDAVIANGAGARYILVPQPLAQRVQKSADNYMFDSRILVRIEDADEIEALIVAEIDGVIFSDAIIG